MDQIFKKLLDVLNLEKNKEKSAPVVVDEFVKNKENGIQKCNRALLPGADWGAQSSLTVWFDDKDPEVFLLKDGKWELKTG